MDYLPFIYLVGMIPAFFISIWFYNRKEYDTPVNTNIQQSFLVGLTWPAVLFIIILIWLLED